jgi:hypothetical protein
MNQIKDRRLRWLTGSRAFTDRMLPAPLVEGADEATMLLDVDAATLAQMADTLLQERADWTLKQWHNQCRFFAALASEIEQGALADSRPWVASDIRKIAWAFASQAGSGWPAPTRFNYESSAAN